MVPSPSSAQVKPVCQVLCLQGLPILDQLLLEEGLLRADTGCWFIWNEAPPPAIVLGISSSIHDLIHREAWERTPLPMIRRFSGGGTVVLDESSLLATWIMDRQHLPHLPHHPQGICQWIGELLKPLGISLHEQDFCLGSHKIGGNAQYCRPSRWLHHTSFLWDYSPERMALLNHPSRQPAYRAQRSHEEFCGRLARHLASPHVLRETILQQLGQWCTLETVSWCDAKTILEREHRRTVVEERWPV